MICSSTCRCYAYNGECHGSANCQCKYTDPTTGKCRKCACVSGVGGRRLAAGV